MQKRLYPIWASLALLIIFAIYYIVKGNYEFLTYVLAIGFVLFFIFKSNKYYQYSKLARWGFFVWMLLHMLGGSLYLNGIRLYDIMLLKILPDPYNILRYDQFVHAFCYFVITLFVYSVVKFATREKIKTKTALAIVFLASIGIGALNEIIEFLTVALFNSQGVGGYFNNALDLIFNSIGALIAVIYANKRDN